jgi:hypothetical protein
MTGPWPPLRGHLRPTNPDIVSISSSFFTSHLQKNKDIMAGQKERRKKRPGYFLFSLSDEPRST